MAKTKKITLYVINHCNQWHEYSSFHLIGVVTADKLDSALTKIKRELHYTDEDMQDYIDVKEVKSDELDI